jgi:hypothetical protein
MPLVAVPSLHMDFAVSRFSPIVTADWERCYNRGALHIPGVSLVALKELPHGD